MWSTAPADCLKLQLPTLRHIDEEYRWC
jgi:hypothetical protein